MAFNRQVKDVKRAIVGTCPEMCPKSEYDFRVKNEMIHRLETVAGGRLQLVKEFRRSAAGSNDKGSRPEELRPPKVCLKTAEYLTNIYSDNPGDISIYDFVFDRLRSVRQDLVVQQVPNDQDVAQVIQVCVKFHLVAGYCLTEAGDFDSRTNFCHLLENLKTLLVLLKNIDPDFKTQSSVEMASVYILLNLGSMEAMRWAFELPKCVRMQPTIANTIRLGFQFLERNFVGVFKSTKKLSLLQLLAFHWNLSHIYGEILRMMSTAYNSKVSTFPSEHFISIFLLNGNDHLVEVLESSGLEVSESGGGIKFVKANFVQSKIRSQRWFMIDEILKTSDDLISCFASLQF